MGKHERSQKYIMKIKIKPMFGFLVTVLFWFSSVFCIIILYRFAEVLLSLSILAFVVIISLIVWFRILADGKENLSKNLNMLKGEEEVKVSLNEEVKSPLDKRVVNSINMPIDYIPDNKPEEPKALINFFDYKINDLFREMVELLPSIILIWILSGPISRYFDDQAFKVMFFYSFLFFMLAFWRFRKVYFEKG